MGFIISVVLTGAENLWAYSSRSGHSTSFCLVIKSSFKHSLLQVLYRPDTYPVEVPNPIERFIHSVYEGDCWELFKKKKLSNEGLPPTRTILILHCCRLNYCCKVAKSYEEFSPTLESPHGKGILCLPLSANIWLLIIDIVNGKQSLYNQYF